MNTIFDDFTNCYQVSKTLRFSLLAIGKTSEHIKKDGIIAEDAER